MSTETRANPDAIEATKQQIRGLVQEIAQLSQSELSPAEFYREYLQRVVSALAAVGGAVWVRGAEGRLELAAQINLANMSLADDQEELRQHGMLLRQVMEGGEGRLVPPHSGGTAADEGGNPTRFLLVVSPLKSENQIEGVVEIFQRPDASPAVQRGYLRFLLQMADLAGDFLKSHKLRLYGDKQSLWSQIDTFTRQVHESLDLKEAAYTIVNEGRRLIGCDRVSLAVKRGRKCVVEAVSGQDTLEKRSNTVTNLGRLASRVVAAGEPLWYTGSTEDMPPQIEYALQTYVDESFSKTVAVIPLRKPVTQKDKDQDADPLETQQGEVLGALIVEQIEDVRPKEALSERVDLVAEHASRSLTNVQRYNSIFLISLWRLIGSSKMLLRAKTLPKALLVVGLLTGLVGSMFFIQTDFFVHGRGVLEPVRSRDVFVTTPGVVMDVKVKHGQDVKKGDVLAQLQNTELDIQLADVVGQIGYTRQQVKALTRAISEGDSLDRQDRNRLIGERAQLEERLNSLEGQKKLLEEKKNNLIIKSPIEGTVVTWNVEQLLMRRPVQGGQVLMTIADTKGPWRLKVDMSESRAGKIDRTRRQTLAAIAANNKDRDKDEGILVEYVVATSPDKTHQGKVVEIDPAAEADEMQKKSTVRVEVKIDKADLEQPRPGATVRAKVYCGQRSLGYVWFHEVGEFFQTRVFF